jgi:hypothetical protein
MSVTCDRSMYVCAATLLTRNDMNVIQMTDYSPFHLDTY